MTKAKPKTEAQGADPFMVNALADRMFCDIDFGNLKLAVTAKLADRLLGGESAEALLKRSRDALLAPLVEKLSAGFLRKSAARMPRRVSRLGGVETQIVSGHTLRLGSEGITSATCRRYAS